MKILITGALSNIGYALAKKLALRGHIIYAGVKTKEEQKTLEKKLNEEKIIMFPIVINLLNKSFNSINRLDLDCLILQAGVGEGGSILELSSSRLEETFKVNVLGNYNLIQTYLRSCLKTNKKGKIFLISSLAAFLPLPYLMSYTSSKLYLYHLAKTLKLELAYQRINVSISLIMPGAYKTGFNDLMIDNKYKDKLILKEKAVKMTLYQKLLFTFLEQNNYDTLVTKVVFNVEKNKPAFLISEPFSQKIFIKLYIFILSLVV